MTRTLQVRNITKWIKLFTYISATVLLITNNEFDQLPFLIPILVLIILISYIRDHLQVTEKIPNDYIWIGVALEMALIISIGLFDVNDINLLLFFICVSSVMIIHPVRYSIVLVLAFMASLFIIFILRNGVDQLGQSFVPMLFNYGVSIAFVVGMSYLVKLQIREKEKLAHLNEELEQAYRKLILNSDLAQKLSVEQERTRVAREIHDTLAHTLTTLIVQLEACKKVAALDPPRLQGELEKAQELSRSGFNDIKHSIKALRPQVMEEKSFIASITAMIQDAMENTDIHITLNNLLSSEETIPSQIEIALFRVIQESITNSLRHGKGDKIHIEISNDRGDILLSIKDNGAGCASIKKGYGLLGIGERIETLKGRVEFLSAIGQGFVTNIFIPMEVH